MKYAILVAGGTGGHINAALAIGEALRDGDWEIEYLTGKRPLDYKLFHGTKVKHLNSRPLRTLNPFILFKNLALNLLSFFLILIEFIKKRPSFIVGAGGYVCGPTLLAGYLLFIPVFIIEQNAVMGLTNKILGWISKCIFVHFRKTYGLSDRLSKKVIVVGNPTRKSIQPVNARVFDGELRVLVFGGSLGASQINKVIWDILKFSDIENLNIHHQVGADVTPPMIFSKAKYVSMNYIEDIQREYDWCDVIICRSGASTISELSIIKKPALLFPFPAATDNHQFYNAEIFKSESDFTVEVLDPKLGHEDCVKLTQDFLSKAYRQELKYSKIPSRGNHTCNEILREISLHVGMA
jgi:UDP-N-acetylglucosamine--N-acetylmuramyl-(pentapeptide) pyrophosphoryl-undecaprenol N-acetylglucosamine transferase